MRDSRELEVVLFALALFLSSGLTQLYAKQASMEAPSIYMGKAMSYVRWHMLEVAKVERREGYDFAPGD